MVWEVEVVGEDKKNLLGMKRGQKWAKNYHTKTWRQR